MEDTFKRECPEAINTKIDITSSTVMEAAEQSTMYLLNGGKIRFGSVICGYRCLHYGHTYTTCNKLVKTFRARTVSNLQCDHELQDSSLGKYYKSELNANQRSISEQGPTFVKFQLIKYRCHFG